MAAPVEENAIVYRTAKFRGASECLRCHTRQTGADSEEFVLLTEYTTWRLSDRHSLAYAVLEGPRGQQIGRALGLDVTRQEAGCLQCHALHSPSRAFTKDKAEDLKKDGVSCEVCHGPAEKWFGPHSEAGWRRRSPQQKFAEGMYDVRDPDRQAKLCLSCHLGDAAEGKVLTHAMYAAGHPPLRSVELASFGDRMPRHWRLLPDVPYLQKLAAAVRREANAEDRKVLDSYHFSTADTSRSRQVLASSHGCLRTAMALVAERSRLPKKGTAEQKGAERRWPELTLKAFAEYKDDMPSLWPQLAMAQADCYGCHHELRRPSWREERGYTGPPGRPQLLPWPTALARLGVGLSPNDRSALVDSLRSLTSACNERPFGDPAKLATAAGAIVEKGNWATPPIDRRQLLTLLCQLPDSEYPDFDSARQVVAAIQIVYAEALRSSVPRLEPDPAIEQWLATWSERLDLGPDAGRPARQRRLIAALAKLSGEKLPDDPKMLQALDRLADHGFEEFKSAKENADLIKALDRLLETVRSRAGVRLRDVLSSQDPALLEDLQKIGDEQWNARAKKMRQYNPRELKKELMRLALLLPRSGG